MSANRTIRIVHITSTIVQIILLFIISIVICKPKILDDAFLFENRYETLWSSIIFKMDKIQYIKADSYMSDNLFVLTVGDTEKKGISLNINENSSIHISGYNKSDKKIWIRLSEGSYLLDGRYTYYDQVNEEGVTAYVYAQNRGKDREKKYWLNKNDFEVNSKLYDNYVIGIAIPFGARNLDIDIFPVVREFSYSPKKEYCAGWRLFSKWKGDKSKIELKIPDNKYKEITSREWRVFNRVCKYQYPYVDKIALTIVKNGKKTKQIIVKESGFIYND